ncbi:MAG: hypothetical protein GX301_03325 [Gracilibacteraceae bacterium]|jgi:hypothetical protein|nr:hypothetical protein [Gracilibacteraceae bacterium]
MPDNRYNSIKKYAAFIFAVFTVLSGSSEVFDFDSIVKGGKKALIDILAEGRLFEQDERLPLSRTHIQSVIQNNEELREFLNAENIQVCISTPLICSLNNVILKNNIWKNAVF